MIALLPIELVIETLSHLPVQSLRTFRLVSWKCNHIVQENQSYLYHSAARVHQFLPSADVTLPDLISQTPQRLGDEFQDWKGYCQMEFQIEKNWLGKPSLTSPNLTIRTWPHGNRVHRLKIDEQRGLIITTHMQGGLFVSDMSEHKILWTLPRHYVFPFVHCEYDNGYIVFNRENNKEVWRVASEWNGDQDISLVSPPDWNQLTAAQLALTYADGRGQFMPCALIPVPEQSRAFRLFFPTLAVAGRNSYHLWDVRTGVLIQSMVDPDLDTDLVNYVEVSERHVFVSRLSEICVYARTDGRRVLTIDANFVPTHAVNPSWDESSSACIVPQQRCWPIRLQSPLGRYPTDPEFVAVHVSGCGSHLVALRHNAGLLMIRNFEDIVSGASTMEASALHVMLPQSMQATYLAVDGNRFAASTASGIFILTPFPKPHVIDTSATNPVFPYLNVSKTCPEGPDYETISCLQITKSSLGCAWLSIYENECLMTLDLYLQELLD